MIDLKRNDTSSILNCVIWGECETRPMTDQERFKYRSLKPNTYEFDYNGKEKKYQKLIVLRKRHVLGLRGEEIVISNQI